VDAWGAPPFALEEKATDTILRWQLGQVSVGRVFLCPALDAKAAPVLPALIGCVFTSPLR